MMSFGMSMSGASSGQAPGAQARTEYALEMIVEDVTTAPEDRETSRLLLQPGDATKQECSYDLSIQDLKSLANARGHVPHLSFAPADTTAEYLEAARMRVAELDTELRERVQSICDRVAEKGQKKRGDHSCFWNFVNWDMVRLGVVRDVWPHTIFFATYSMCIAYRESQKEWSTRWSAQVQDAIYYIAMVLAFLICFRASGCMDRYKEGIRTMFEMEKCLREMTFEVVTRLRVDTAVDLGAATSVLDAETASLRRRYFKHEFRRMTRLLFACASRDLNDSALDDEEPSEDDAAKIQCAMTQVEHSAILVTHSSFGHAFRVYLAAAWLQKLVAAAATEHFFDDDRVTELVEVKVTGFKDAWLQARQVAYTSMPASVTHILWWLTTAMSFFMPWEWVSVCRWSTWFPSVLLSISFYGIMAIADAMENPFGFDEDDIQIWEVAEHLDEEICLTMHYANLDEYAGENLYRSMMGVDMCFVEDTEYLKTRVEKHVL